MLQGAVHYPHQAVIDVVGAQYLRGQRRGQGQGDEAGEHHGGGHGQGELGEQLADIPAQKGNGHEYRNQHQGGGDHRKTDLAGAAEGGDQRGFALLVDAPADVFQHYDGVIHHQRDGQHQRQQGQQVDGEAKDHQRDEGGGHRHRQGYGGHQYRPGAAEEQEDRQHHQYQGDGQGFIHFADGPFDKHRAVETRAEQHALGQDRVDLLDQFGGGAGDFQSVGGGLTLQTDTDHGHAVAAEQVALLLGAAFDQRYIAQAYQVIVRTPGHHQLGEVLGGIEGALNAHGELAVDRLDTAGGQLDVFLTQGLFHILHGEVVCGQQFGIQPHAHGPGLAPAYPHPGHALDIGEAVDQVAVGVVGQLGDREAIAVKVPPHHYVLVGVLFLDFRGVGLDRQVRQDARDPVAHVVGGFADIPVDGKAHRDPGAAILTA